MTDFNNLSFKIKIAQEKTDEMINAAEKQGIVGFRIIYDLKDILNQLENKTSKLEKLDKSFIQKWNLVIGKVFRGLEGTILSTLLDEIEDLITKKQD